MFKRIMLPLMVLSVVGCASKQTLIDDLGELPATESGEMVLNVHFWSGINGKPVRSLTRNARYPDGATSIEPIYTLDFPDSRADKYGQRIVGLLDVKATGNYRFWISADHSAELWLSIDQNPLNKRLIAYNNNPTGYRVWDKFNSQRSTLIELQAGERYFIEVLHKEYLNEDYLSVAWEGPGFELRTLDSNDVLGFGHADSVSGESAFKEGYHVGYASGSVLSEFDDSYPPLDTDGDGLPDFYELAVGLNPEDATDAFSDNDSDLLTAYEEYQIRTNPNNADSDGDGMPDGFEFVYGLAVLDPSDALLDADGDGSTNIDEYIAGSSPDDGADFPDVPLVRTVYLYWDVPTQREDGSPLSVSEIDKYLLYAGTSSSELEAFAEISDAAQQSYSSELVQGTYYFAISTVTNDGIEGPKSEILRVFVE